MALDLAVSIAGAAGQGVQLVSRSLALVLVRSGYQVFVSQDLMSRIRGGDNCARLRVANHPVAVDADACDLLVALKPESLESHIGELRPNGWVLVDGEPLISKHVLQMPFRRLAAQYGGGEQTANSVAAGAVLAVIGADATALDAVLASQFSEKGSAMVEANQAAARAGREHVLGRASDWCLDRFPVRSVTDASLLLSGAEAIALGAIAAGVRLVAGYPMSPGTPILEYCARHSSESGVLVEQTEDEIAAINLAIGASFAGAPAMVATAGGGFALMNEALSLAGVTETPIVLCVGMRPGPATGMATRTAQADLLTAIYAGHGEFPRAVLAPADAEGAFRAAQDAFYLSGKYQTPAILLFDQFLGDALWTVPVAGFDYRAPTVPVPVPPAKPFSYERYAAAADGRSPLLVPGTTGQLVYADSDEHSAAGHITESAEVRREQMCKRATKLKEIAREMRLPQQWPEGRVETLVLSFGSTRGVVREALERLRSAGTSIGMVHIEQVWPFPAAVVEQAARRARRIVTVEGNATGQLAQLVTQECRLRVGGGARRYDGRQLRVGEVEQALGQLTEQDAA